ncbi:MAG: hypothetical protein JWP38_1813 [Herbaspirillum sp.]|nr:hypothetical protein [Herbaspirillum sp.]
MKVMQRKIVTAIFAAGLLSIGGSALADDATPPTPAAPSEEICKIMYETLQTALSMGNYDASMAIMQQIADRGC